MDLQVENKVEGHVTCVEVKEKLVCSEKLMNEPVMGVKCSY